MPQTMPCWVLEFEWNQTLEVHEKTLNLIFKKVWEPCNIQWLKEQILYAVKSLFRSFIAVLQQLMNYQNRLIFYRPITALFHKKNSCLCLDMPGQWLRMMFTYISALYIKYMVLWYLFTVEMFVRWSFKTPTVPFTSLCKQIPLSLRLPPSPPPWHSLSLTFQNKKSTSGQRHYRRLN